MLLLGHILKDDFKPDFCNYVSTNVEYARMQYDACSGLERGVCLLYDNSEHVPSSSPHDTQHRRGDDMISGPPSLL